MLFEEIFTSATFELVDEGGGGCSCSCGCSTCDPKKDDKVEDSEREETF